MIKILHLIPTSGPGGAEKLLIDIVSSLNKNKYHSVVGMLNTGWLTEKIEESGTNIRLIKSGGAIDYVLLKHLIHLIKLENIDLIHSHLLDMNLYAALLSKITKTPLICTEHGDIHHSSKRSWKNILKAKIISKFSDNIVFVSQYTEDYFLRYVKLPSSKRSIIYNSVDENIFKKIDIEQKKELRKKLRLNENATLIVNVGNLYPVKGQINLIHSFSIVKEYIPNSELLIIGRGQLEGKLKKEVEDLRLTDCVRFMGFREDVSDILKSADIFVLSSLSEGLPIALIEAMSCGLSIVATNVGGVKEVIQDGIDGFTVPPEDPINMAERIRLLIDGGPTIEIMRENASKKATTVFSRSAMVQNYECLYDRVVRFK